MASSTDFAVTASAGTLRRGAGSGWTVPHDWTPEGVVVDGQGNGAAVLHLSVALCVLNDTFREGAALEVPCRGPRPRRRRLRQGELGVHRHRLRGGDRLVGVGRRGRKVLDRVDEVAEIPRVLRAGMSVERAHE